jgi:RimJ/RimL family protein N-acetyltransferase
MILETERLILREWREQDRAPFAAMSADPAVMEFLRALPTREACDQWIDYQIAHHVEHGFGFWVVEARTSGAFLGTVGLFRIFFDAPFTPAVEIGWRLARDHWGKGYATEAAAAALDHGFGPLGLAEIVAFTVPANRRSERVMQRLGMRRDAAGDFDHPRVAAGHPLSRHILYRLTRADWRGARPA